MNSLFINKRRSSQSGYFLALGAIVVAALFILVGLAADSAQLYRARLRLQRAYDAGAIAGSKVSGTVNVDRGPFIAEQVTRINLEAMGYDPGDFQVNAFWADGADKSIMHVDGNVSLPLWFMRIVPSMTSHESVETSARAASKRSVVVLVLDVTGSMNELAGGVRKLDALKTAAKNFINLFEPGYDYMAIVKFSELADIPPGADMTSNFSHFGSIVDTLSAGGFTNTQLGLWLAEHTMKNALIARPDLTAAHKAIVLVTDGAPTHSCNSLVEIDPALDPHNRPYDCQLFTVPKHRDNYDRALLQADAVRASSGVAIYTIGIGALRGRRLPDGSGYATDLERDDAYQDYRDEVSLKSNFLRRIANVAPPNNTEPVHYFRSGILNNAQYNPALVPPGHPAPARGLYLATSRADELNALFQTIGSSLKGRLIR
ncbi:MAG: TadE/TadG family protein [Deltaproteobacteria bacterium]|nr:TadE/TadG family protein [Deltaproteobacteria bacterium]